MSLARATFASLALALLVTPSLGHAAEQAPADVAAQLSSRGLSFLAAEAKKRVPRLYSHPSYTKQLVDCPFTESDTVLSLSGTKTMLTVRDLLVFTDGPALAVLVKVDVSGFSNLNITRPYACLGYPLACRLDYIADRLVASARFTPRMVGGRIRLQSPRVQVSISPKNLQAGATGCGLVGDLVNLALTPAKGYLASQLQAALERVLEEQVAPQLEQMLAGMTGGSVDAAGYRISAQLADLSASSRGLQVAARTSVLAGQRAACAQQSALPPPAVTSTPATLGRHDEQLGLALSASTLQNAVQAAWQSGLLCLSNDQLVQAGVTAELPSFAGYLLGLSGKAPLSIVAPTAPELTLLPSLEGARLQLRLPALELHIAGQGPQGPVQVIAGGDAKLSLELGLDALTRSVVVRTASGSLDGLTLTADRPEGLQLDRPMLLKLISGLVGSMVGKRLTGLTLTPQVLVPQGGPLDGYLLDLRRAQTSESQLDLYVDFFAVPAYDARRPDSGFVRRPPERTSQQAFTFEALGRDDQTPASLLRYSFRIDGGAWTPIAYGATFSVSLEEGAHRVETRATDQNGNSDDTPARIDVVVDPAAPAGEWGKGDGLRSLVVGEDQAGGCSLGGAQGWGMGSALWLVLGLALLVGRRRRG